jgi:hypothetical protein
MDTLSIVTQVKEDVSPEGNAVPLFQRYTRGVAGNATTESNNPKTHTEGKDTRQRKNMLPIKTTFLW